MWHSSVSRYHGPAIEELYTSATASVIVAQPNTGVTFTIATNAYRDTLPGHLIFFPSGTLVQGGKPRFLLS